MKGVTTLSESHVIPDDDPSDVIVVGGGLAGLVTARLLARAGKRVDLLESRAELGGCVRPFTLTGDTPEGPVAVTIDAGAESFSTNSAAVTELLDELGLSSKLTSPTPNGVFLATSREPVRVAESGFLGIPGSIRDVVRTCGWGAGLRAVIDQVLPSTVGVGRPDEPTSLGKVVRRRLGRGVLQGSVAPVVGNINMTHPDLLDVDAVAPGLRKAIVQHGSLVRAAAALRAKADTLTAVSGLTGGFHQIVAALARDIIDAGGRIHTGVTVERAVPSTETSDWRITALGPAQDGSFEAAIGSRVAITLSAKHLVFAGDASTVENILGPVVPDLPQAAHRGGVNIVTLLLHAPELDSAPCRTSVLVTDDAAQTGGTCAKALTHVNAKWDWLAEQLPESTHVVRLSYGHLGSDPDVAEARSQTLARSALHTASLLLDVRFNPQHLIDHQVTRYPPGLPYIAVGHAARVDRVRAHAAQLPGLHLTGAWIAGTGVGAVVTDAQRVAEQLLAADPAVVETDDAKLTTGL